MTSSKPSGGATTKRTRSAGVRTKRPKSAQSVVTRVSPEAVERFADAITRFLCAVSRPAHLEPATDTEKPSRAELGAKYIAAIAEQRPGVEGHGYPGGHPDWDRPQRLFWTGTLDGAVSFVADRSVFMPEWMALPLVMRAMADPEIRKRLMPKEDESD